jgi:ubiquinone biosynthesis protein
MNSMTSALDRHKRITLLFLKHSSRLADQLEPATARNIATDIEDLGGPFIRAAKMLSVREDLVPAPALDAFAELEDHRLEDIEPDSPDVIDQVVEEELGKKILRAFASFHPIPSGFSGIGQIHHATLHDGRRVLVRIQRPRLRRRISEDLDTLAEIATFLDDPAGRMPSRFSRLVDRLRVELLRELDYRQEEESLNWLRESLDGRDRLRVPEVVHEFSSSRVLTTEFIDGSELWEIRSHPAEKESRELAAQLLSGHLDELLFHGRIHPQPHLENLLLTPEGDLAIIGASGSVQLSNSDRLLLHHFLSGLCRKSTETIAEALARLVRSGTKRGATDAFSADLRHALGETHLNKRVLRSARIASLHGCPPPSFLCRLADLFQHLSSSCRILCPAFDAEGFITSYLNRHLMDDGDKAVRFTSTTAA